MVFYRSTDADCKRTSAKIAEKSEKRTQPEASWLPHKTHQDVCQPLSPGATSVVRRPLLGSQAPVLTAGREEAWRPGAVLAALRSTSAVSCFLSKFFSPAMILPARSVAALSCAAQSLRLSSPVVRRRVHPELAAPRPATHHQTPRIDSVAKIGCNRASSAPVGARDETDGRFCLS